MEILESDKDFEEVRDDEDTNKHVEDEGQESEYNCSGDDNRGMDKRTCNICFRMFYSMGNMRALVKHHHEGKGRLACHACEKTYSSKAALEYHVRREHSNEAEIKCDKCSETFHDFAGYATHRRSHKSVYFQLEHKCKECDKIIRGKWNLHQHRKEVHEIEILTTQTKSLSSSIHTDVMHAALPSREKVI